MTINNNIKTIRQLAGKKQADFATYLGITVANLKSYENMEVMPKPPVQAKIAELAGMTIQELHNRKLSPSAELPSFILDKKDKIFIPLDDRGQELDAVENSSRADFVRLLQSNDQFFKHQFSDYSNQVIANLTVLQKQTKYIETLIQVSLKHIGAIEASQSGVRLEDIRSRINEDMDALMLENLEANH